MAMNISLVAAEQQSRLLQSVLETMEGTLALLANANISSERQERMLLLVGIGIIGVALLVAIQSIGMALVLWKGFRKD